MSMSLTPNRFRTLLGHFATGVCVLTSRSASGTPEGMTVSALSSVSLSPPLLLVCVGRGAAMVPSLMRERHFGLSILASDQQSISEHFATSITLEGIPHLVTEHGVALLSNTCAGIECERHDVVDGGDHVVFFGLVVDGRHADRPPLIHVRGEYAALRDSASS